ncbi:MAG: zinc ribbon domain-containing protein [Prevotellaceae bacterium]|jgi:ribosomal protein L40E|nr:zinc ribbon domain-containing protein [Prevotellaceae bacterium]
MKDTFICRKCNEHNSTNAKFCSNCGYELNGKKIFTKKQKNNMAFVIAFFLVCFIVKLIFFNAPAVDKELLQTASEMNKMCPVMVDSETRLDNTSVKPGKVFQYNYTLVNMSKDNVDTVELKNILEPGIINSLKSSPDMQYQRDHNVTLNYSYKDKNGFHLFVITVPADRYKQKL